MSVLTGAGKGSVRRPREAYVVHFPHYDKDDIGPASAIFLRDFKLIHIYETGAMRLFDIARDPGERRNLASKMPEKQELDRRLLEELAAMNAQLPSSHSGNDSAEAPATKSDRDVRHQRNDASEKKQQDRRPDGRADARARTNAHTELGLQRRARASDERHPHSPHPRFRHVQRAGLQ